MINNLHNLTYLDYKYLYTNSKLFYNIHTNNIYMYTFQLLKSQNSLETHKTQQIRLNTSVHKNRNIQTLTLNIHLLIY
jgi:hypothetical protein